MVADFRDSCAGVSKLVAAMAWIFVSLLVDGSVPHGVLTFSILDSKVGVCRAVRCAESDSHGIGRC